MRLTVDSLRCVRGGAIVVDDVGFAVEHGAVLALLGANGAGKTTTMRAVAGLIRPQSGVVAIDGERLGDERSRRIVLIPETPRVFALLTVWEHIEFVARSCRLGPTWRAQAETVLERLQLGPHRNKLGRALSKGMRQKTLIAATMLCDADVIFLDEPTIGLDAAAQLELGLFLRELAATKIVVISTHHLEPARELCSRAVTLHAGRVISDGPLA